jgi:hypothetical protein
MRKILIVCGLGACLVLPAGAVAVKPVDKQNAAKECRAERGTDPATQEAFRLKYGTNKNGKNAFGKCVSQKTREEAAERKAARANAAKECRAERAPDEAAFNEKYGTNENDRNAFGKCVSGKAKTLRQRQDAKDKKVIEATKNAARECHAERGDTAESQAAFNTKYGTNENDRNAFGKCVSGKVRES